jgi:hypothetical protein
MVDELGQRLTGTLDKDTWAVTRQLIVQAGREEVQKEEGYDEERDCISQARRLCHGDESERIQRKRVVV